MINQYCTRKTITLTTLISTSMIEWTAVIVFDYIWKYVVIELVTK